MYCLCVIVYCHRVITQLQLINTGCFKTSFTTLKAYRNLYRGHTKRFELSKFSKTHRVLPRIVIRNCIDLFFRFLLHGKKEVEIELDSAAI
jgi:3-methyladenine DNA glycosylase Mpg